MDAANITITGTDFPLLDVIALLWFMACFIGYGMFAEVYRTERRSIITVMDQYRFIWMRQMLKRDNRMFDSGIIGNLMRSISFLASTSILIVAGLVTMLGYRDQAVDIISALPFAVQTSLLLWEIKVLLLILLFTYAFFKYTWSLRTHNYTSIVMGAAPMPDESPALHEDYAQKAGQLAVNAAKHFNRGLRAYYFGLAALSWFMHPLLFIISCTWVVIVIYRREFRSSALASLLGESVNHHSV